MIDVNNNVYVAGYTQGALPAQISYGNGDVFISKLDIMGNLTHYQFGSPGYDRTTSIMTDAYGPASSVPIDVGNVYVAGNTYGTLPGNTNGGGWNDAFIIKNIFK